MNGIEVIENFLKEEDFQQLKKFFISPRSQWRFVDFVVSKQQDNQKKDGYFVHSFKDLNPSINELLNLEEDSYNGGKNGEYHPITWYHEFGGGRSFYTGLGHRGETYHDERFIKLLLGGILYAAGY